MFRVYGISGSVLIIYRFSGYKVIYYGMPGHVLIGDGMTGSVLIFYQTSGKLLINHGLIIMFYINYCIGSVWDGTSVSVSDCVDISGVVRVC